MASRPTKLAAFDRSYFDLYMYEPLSPESVSYSSGSYSSGAGIEEAATHRHKPSLFAIPADCRDLILAQVGADLGKFAAACTAANEAILQAPFLWRLAYEVRFAQHGS
eukprot:6185333-Pleurochrysis_carterae.AAC.4